MSQAESRFAFSGQSLSYLTAICAAWQTVIGAPPASADGHAASSDEGRKAARWSELIEGQLDGWRRDPAQLEDDDVLAPTIDTIRRAIVVARSMRDQRLPPPDRIVPTGDGGIALQFERDREFVSIEIEPEGLVELLVFDGGKLKHRAAFDEPVQRFLP